MVSLHENGRTKNIPKPSETIRQDCSKC